VPVIRVRLVFNEILRFFQLADIMVVRADLGKQSIGADCFSRRFRERRNDNAVMICARRFNNHLLKKRLVEIGQLQQFDIRNKTEQAFKQRRDPRHKNAGHDTADESHDQSDRQIIEKISRDEIKADNRRHIDNAQKETDLQEDGTLTDAHDLIGCGNRSQKRKQRENDFFIEEESDEKRRQRADNQRDIPVDQNSDRHGAHGKGDGVITGIHRYKRERPVDRDGHKNSDFDKKDLQQGDDAENQQIQVGPVGRFDPVSCAPQIKHDGKKHGREEKSQHDRDSGKSVVLIVFKVGV